MKKGCCRFLSASRLEDHFAAMRSTHFMDRLTVAAEQCRNARRRISEDVRLVGLPKATRAMLLIFVHEAGEHLALAQLLAGAADVAAGIDHRQIRRRLGFDELDLHWAQEAAGFGQFGRVDCRLRARRDRITKPVAVQ